MSITNTKLPLNLNDLLRQRTVEGESIEYKAGWNPDAIIPTLCVFANAFENQGGGYVVIGQDCDANGQPVFPPVGLPDNQPDKIQRELLAHCQLIQPPYFPVLSLDVVEGRNLIVLQAPGRADAPLQGTGNRHCQQENLALLHPPLQQHGRGQGRHRTGTAESGRQGAVRRPLQPVRARR